MTDEKAADDIGAIKALVERQFASLSWPQGGAADWSAFEADFFPDASLYPAARPAGRQSIAEFVQRMLSLSKTKLKSFDETVLGVDVQVFGNVAIASAAGEMIENGVEQTRAVEMMLLVKTEDEWKIVAQAWDTEKPGNPVPKRLLEG